MAKAEQKQCKCPMKLSLTTPKEMTNVHIHHERPWRLSTMITSSFLVVLVVLLIIPTLLMNSNSFTTKIPHWSRFQALLRFESIPLLRSFSMLPYCTAFMTVQSTTTNTYLERKRRKEISGHQQQQTTPTAGARRTSAFFIQPSSYLSHDDEAYYKSSNENKLFKPKSNCQKHQTRSSASRKLFRFNPQFDRNRRNHNYLYGRTITTTTTTTTTAICSSSSSDDVVLDGITSKPKRKKIKRKKSVNTTATTTSRKTKPTTAARKSLLSSSTKTSTPKKKKKRSTRKKRTQVTTLKTSTTGTIKKKKKKRKSKTSTSTNEPIFWKDSGDKFTLTMPYENSLLSDRASTSTSTSTSIHQRGNRKKVHFIVRGKPSPLQRHRMSGRFVFNPSANKQNEFRQVVKDMMSSSFNTTSITSTASTTAMNSYSTTASADNHNGVDLIGHNSSATNIMNDTSSFIFPIDDLLSVTILFRMKRPNSHFIGGKPGHGRLRPIHQGKCLHPIRADVDNLAKFVLDSLNGLVFEDDRQVVTLQCTKLLDSEKNCTGATEVVVEKIEEKDIGQFHSMLFD